MMIRLENQFHGTTTMISVEDDGRIPAKRLSRARHRLCGLAHCDCSLGQIVGVRGETIYILREMNNEGDAVLEETNIAPVFE